MRFLIILFTFNVHLYSQWFEVILPQNYPVLNEIKFINDNVAIVVGDSGTILRTNDGGFNWSNLLANTTKNLNSITISQNHIYVCGDSGIILSSSNQGNTLNLIPFPFRTNLSSIFFIDTLNGYVVGENSIFKTTNKGANWIQQTKENNLFNSVYFLNNNIGFVSSLRILSPGNFNSAIYKTTNGGIDWFIQVSTPGEELYEIYFIDSVGYIVGEHEKVFRTTNFGYTWYEPRPTTLPRIESFFSTFFVDKLTGWVTGDVQKIYKTSNGGLDWEIQLSRWHLNKQVLLSSIAFKDGLNGLAVGSQRINFNYFAGIIFKTTNGGVTFIEDDDKQFLPNDFVLFQNYPNPFSVQGRSVSGGNPGTKISWQSPVGSWQTIKLYNALGEEIDTIVEGYYEAGKHSTLYIIHSTLPSGVYFYQLRAENTSTGSLNGQAGQVFVQTKKMILMQ